MVDHIFLAVLDSHWLTIFWFQRHDYTDSDLDLDWERFGELVTYSDTVHYYWQIANLNPDIEE